MRAALISILLAALAAPAAAAAPGTPLPLAERQIVTLEFSHPVARVSTTDPDLIQVQVTGPKVRIEAARAGRATLELTFADGATVSYAVSVEAARRTPAAMGPTGGSELALSVGEERRFRSPGVARVMFEENGVARVAIEGETISVVALGQGRSSMVLVDAAGAKTTWQILVR